MKKECLLFVISLIILGIYSCKKESKSPTPKDLIVGNWIGTLRVDTDYTNGKMTVNSSIYDKNTYVFNYVFNADGTGTSGNQPNTIRSFNYDLTNSAIVFSFPGAVPPISRELRKLTPTELVIRIDTTYTIDVYGVSGQERIISDFHYTHP